MTASTSAPERILQRLDWTVVRRLDGPIAERLVGAEDFDLEARPHRDPFEADVALFLDGGRGQERGKKEKNPHQNLH